MIRCSFSDYIHASVSSKRPGGKDNWTLYGQSCNNSFTVTHTPTYLPPPWFKSNIVRLLYLLPLLLFQQQHLLCCNIFCCPIPSKPSSFLRSKIIFSCNNLLRIVKDRKWFVGRQPCVQSSKQFIIVIYESRVVIKAIF